jgi:protein-S-isoprenylcysteine O-methyltransferase Ste14
MKQKERTLKFKKHEEREDLIGEHPLGDHGQLICAVVFLIVWAIDSFILKLTLFETYIPILIRLVFGISIIWIAWLIARNGMDTIFKEERKNPKVVDYGLFRYSRHPIYLGALLIYVGFLIMSLSISALCVYIIAWIYYDFIAEYEEKLLKARFGSEYQLYSKKVAKWLSFKNI